MQFQCFLDQTDVTSFSFVCRALTTCGQQQQCLPTLASGANHDEIDSGLDISSDGVRKGAFIAHVTDLGFM